MLVSVPLPGKDQSGQEPEYIQAEGETDEKESQDPGQLSSYEAMLENRVKEILRQVEGVGQVDVMIVLKSSEEKVVLKDISRDTDQTREQDSQGGTRISSSSQTRETAVLVQENAGSGQPFVEKELRPEISGIIISASGGDRPQVQSEISQAMEALFGLPAHKIKVLKRVE